MTVFDSPSAAKEAMYKVIKDAVDVSNNVIIPKPHIYWPLAIPNEEDLKNLKGKYWVKVRTDTEATVKQTFGAPAIYNTTGRLVIDVNCPINLKSAPGNGQLYGTMLRNAFIASRAGITFFRPTVGDAPQNRSEWTIYGVAIQFKFDEVL